MPRIDIYVHDHRFKRRRRQVDAFIESEHPRKEDGEFTKGGGSSVKPDKSIPAKEIHPPHEVQNSEKFEDLVASMKENGWQGRPIPVFEGYAGQMALTGSHRIAAAEEAGIDVPVYEISSEAANYVNEDGDDISMFIATGDDTALAKFLQEAGDENAAQLVREEIEANYRSGEL